MLLNHLTTMFTLRKNIYQHKNLITLKDGSSVKLNKLNKLPNYKLMLDNYNENYLTQLNQKPAKKGNNLKVTYSFFKKHSF